MTGVDDLSRRGCGARFRSFALRLVRCSVMISGRRRWRLRRAAICVDDCGGSFPLLGLSFRRRDGSVCLHGFIVPRAMWGVGRFFLPHVRSSRVMRVSFARAWVIAFPLAYPCSYHAPAWRPVRSRRRRRASAEDMPRCLFLILIISSISCGDGGFILIVLGCVASSFPGVLSSHRMRLSCGGRRELRSIRPLHRSRMSWGKRRGM